jgi:hypothetical protein
MGTQQVSTGGLGTGGYFGNDVVNCEIGVIVWIPVRRNSNIFVKRLDISSGFIQIFRKTHAALTNCLCQDSKMIFESFYGLLDVDHGSSPNFAPVGSV